MTLVEFLQRDIGTYPVEDIINNLTTDQILTEFKEFAKFHVGKALEAAVKKGKTERSYLGTNFCINEDSIMNAYPLKNIE